MPAIIPALGGALVVAGIIGVIIGFRPAAATEATAPKRHTRRFAAVDRRTKILAIAGVVVGIIGYVITGWFLALILAPAAVVGLPILLSSPQPAAEIRKLEALEEWTRGLAGVLTVGVGLEEAIRATLRSTPDAIRPEVTKLVARLRARISTEEALRAFAEDLDDATGDMVVAFLITAARRRGQGLATVLNSLAESVAADVRARRAIEADRAKPRATARWITIIMLAVLPTLAFTGDYVAPYGTFLGQMLLTLYLCAFVALLLWMRSLVKGKPMPRFLKATNEGDRP